jgi:hypothetical protein
MNSQMIMQDSIEHKTISNYIQTPQITLQKPQSQVFFALNQSTVDIKAGILGK